MQSELIEYYDGDILLEGCLVQGEGFGPKPLVLVAHDWTGRRQYAIDKAHEIAGLGYAAFAIDMYGKGIFGADGDVALNTALMGPFASDRGLLRQRINAALEAASVRPEIDATAVVAVGYCFGGMCVLELARMGAPVQGVVSVHGILAHGEAANAAITAKVLCLHGHDDPMVPPEQVLAFEQEMTAAQVDWQMHVYGGTTHAFTNPGADNPDFGTVYSSTANLRASHSVQAFLAEVLIRPEI
ncbi:MAG: dienelactone hydrolase family protein [Pseudomonadales bacterium]|nr:dienelactone hydrolase family protein [Pseudomonadales bacterium]